MEQLRESERAKVELRKTVPVVIQTEGKTLHRYVRILDFSEGGMRLSGDLPTPEGEFQLEFDSRVLFKSFPAGSSKLQLKVIQRWKKDMYGDMWMGGFQFLDVTQQQHETMRKILEEHNRNRVDYKVNFGIKKWGKIDWYYPLISNLDEDSIEFQTTEVLNIKENCKIALFLRPSETTVELDADLVSQEEIGSMRFYKLRFKNPPARKAVGS